MSHPYCKIIDDYRELILNRGFFNFQGLSQSFFSTLQNINFCNINNKKYLKKRYLSKVTELWAL